MDVQSGLIMESPLEHGSEDHWVWNEHDKSCDVCLHGQESNRLCLAYFRPQYTSGTAAVRGTKVLNNGRYYWELELPLVISGTTIMFGVATKKARLNAHLHRNLLWRDPHIWSLSHDGAIFHGGKWAHYTEPFQDSVATTLGVLFDGIEGTLTFYKDGVCLGVAFKDLHKINENIYPIIASTAGVTYKLSLKKRDFGSLQERCRAVLLSQLKGPKVPKTDLGRLVLVPTPSLPVAIRNYLNESIAKTGVRAERFNDFD
ncbi:unnamed protein product [Nezara viridula]|uniref:B30.2/SPRY domain-containing protein n=1 Tax=Nezara viridula TaxID=85310 RepID=A0A9P0MU43_NEZVI|nr:unnamed protein product [Nezara viridula]